MATDSSLTVLNKQSQALNPKLVLSENNIEWLRGCVDGAKAYGLCTICCEVVCMIRWCGTGLWYLLYFVWLCLFFFFLFWLLLLFFIIIFGSSGLLPPQMKLDLFRGITATRETEQEVCPQQLSKPIKVINKINTNKHKYTHTLTFPKI